MQLHSLKALEKAKVYPDHMRWGMLTIQELMPEDKRGRCMPYYSYPVPTVEQLCSIISNYSRIEISAEMSDMGSMVYNVKVWIGDGASSEKDFFSPFLDDALAEALLACKDFDVRKQKEIEALKQPKG